MLFASFDFLLFFPVAFIGYWALRRRPAWRALWVVTASYFFYMASGRPVNGPLPTPWYFVGLLLLSTLVDYVCGLRIAAAQRRAAATATGRTGRTGRAWLLLSVVTNLGLLGYFKYTGFLVEIVNDVAATLGFTTGLPTLRILLPIGISFYTFQSLSYTIDVYRGRLDAERSLLRFALFVAFFPQLVAGPIVRANEFLPQLSQRPRLTLEDVDFAVFRVTKGLFKKVVLGDFIAASFADLVFASPATYTSLENLLALYAFTLQIYADFSGYSDIAIGVARLLGFRIPENFERPYQAVDVADFWRRWHMTLSTWLRDYLYYPLGGSRVGPRRTYVNLWLTMFLIGMWHGASWNFVIYSNLQACAMVFNRYHSRTTGSPRQVWLHRLGLAGAVAVLATLLGAVGLRLPDPWSFGAASGLLALGISALPSAKARPALRPLHVLLTVHFSVLSRVFFRADNLDLARTMAGKVLAWDGLGVRPRLFEIQGLATWLEAYPAMAWAKPLADQGILLLLLGGFLLHYVPVSALDRIRDRLLPRVPALLLGVSFAALLGMMSLLLSGPRANIYFAF